MIFRYVKLVKATTGHQYAIECYDSTGVLVKTKDIDLTEIDKLCPKHAKLRMSKTRWGSAVFDRVTSDLKSILPLSRPKFIAE